MSGVGTPRGLLTYRSYYLKFVGTPATLICHVYSPKGLLTRSEKQKVLKSPGPSESIDFPFVCHDHLDVNAGVPNARLDGNTPFRTVRRDGDHPRPARPAVSPAGSFSVESHRLDT